MPTVATYGERRRSTQALPGARLTAAETAISQGAGVARAEGNAAAARAEGYAALGGMAAREGLRAFAEMQEQERQRANEVAMLKASNQLATWRNRALYDPQSGALTRKGEASFELPEAVSSDFERVAGEIEAGLSPEQQLAFQRVRSQEWQNVDLQVRRHVFGEMQEFHQNELKAAVALGADQAIRAASDPRLVSANLAKVEDQIRSNARGLGLGPDQVEQQVRTVRSSVHVGVINNLLAEEKTKEAETYYAATRGEIDADKLDQVTTALEAGGIRKEAQATSDRILAEGGSLTSQREKARTIADPKLRDEVMARLEHEAAVTDRAEREADRDRLRSVYDTIDQTKSVASIPPDVWATMDGPERSAARGYARNLAEGIPTQTDDPTFYALMRQAMSDPQGFARVNLLSSRAKLSSGDFQQLAGLQLSIVNGERSAAAKELDGFRTKTQLVDDALTTYGIDPNAKPDTKEGQAIAGLRRMLDRRVEAVQSTGVKVTNAEIQEALDGLLSQSVTVPGSWWNIFPGGRPFFNESKRVIDMTIDDVPADDRRRIEQALRARGRTVSDVTVLDIYRESKVR